MHHDVFHPNEFHTAIARNRFQLPLSDPVAVDEQLSGGLPAGEVDTPDFHHLARSVLHHQDQALCRFLQPEGIDDLGGAPRRASRACAVSIKQKLLSEILAI